MAYDGKRASFSGKMGFIFATAASAVGLGNLWRFPYEVSHNGGGIFVLIYLILAFTFGTCLMMMEIAYGRRTGKSGVAAFLEYSKKFRIIGYLTTLTPIIMVSYYCVIGGWVLKWFFETLLGNLSELAGDGSYWIDFITGSMSEGLLGPMLWFLIFASICMFFISMGVNKGVERMSMILMPITFILIIGIILYELFCVDGVMDGVAFYLDPDLSELSPDTFVAAISQVFFSLSISIGVLVTYGSYISKDVDLERSAISVVLVDSTVALLAGLMIIPVAFIFGHQDSSGMGLMFTALPQVFQTMPGGNIVAPIFYLMVFFAAITSAASLSEAAVSSISDSRKLSRKKSAGALMAIMLVLGTICVLGFDKGPLFIDGMGETTGWLGIMDSFINIFLMPLAAILMCVLIGYVLKTRFIEEEITVSSKFRLKPMFKVMVMVIAPVFLAIILIVGVIGLVT